MIHKIHKDTMVIGIDNNNNKVNRKISDLEPGFKIVGYDLNNDCECLNTVLEIIPLSAPKENQMRLWFNTETNGDTFVVIDKDQELDYFNLATNNWEYKKADDFECTDIAKSFKDQIKVGHHDYNCDMNEDEFVALRLDNSHNFYARRHEMSEEQQKEEMKKQRSKDVTDQASENNLIKEPVVYDKLYTDCILIRSEK